MSNTNFTGKNTENLIQKADETGKSSYDTRKGAAEVHKIAKVKDDGVHICEQVRYATGTKEGVFADKKYVV